MGMLAPSITALTMTGHARVCVAVQVSGVAACALATALMYPAYGFHAALVAAAVLNVLQHAALTVEARRRLGFWALPFARTPAPAP